MSDAAAGSAPAHGTVARVPPMQPGVTGSEPPDLAYLFVSCLAPNVGLTDSDYQKAADALKVEVAAVKAVAAVESKLASFDDTGRPTVLFERHYFHKFTHGKFDATAPDISKKSAGGYGKYSAQYDKIARAFALSQDAALLSASWGRFQIMGANYREAGHSSVREFVLAMTRSDFEQLTAFVNFVRSDKKRLKALQEKNWASFAKYYNGKNFKVNKYDEKLKAEYEKLASPTMPPKK